MVTDFCLKMNVTKKLRDELRESIENNFQKNAFLWEKETNFLEEIPYMLRYEIEM